MLAHQKNMPLFIRLPSRIFLFKNTSISAIPAIIFRIPAHHILTACTAKLLFFLPASIAIHDATWYKCM